jgi:hypothetical protein
MRQLFLSIINAHPDPTVAHCTHANRDFCLSTLFQHPHADIEGALIHLLLYWKPTHIGIEVGLDSLVRQNRRALRRNKRPSIE